MKRSCTLLLREIQLHKSKTKNPERGFLFCTLNDNVRAKILYMKMSVSVMAHPKRKEFFPYLKRHLPGAFWSIDEGKGLIWNCRNAWGAYDPKADYHVVIQDDALICRKFFEKAEEVLKKAEGLPVSFFHVSPLSYAKHRHQRIQNGCIIQHGLSGGVALCLPTKLIPAMLAFYDASKLPCDDHRVGTFLSTRKIPWYFPMPSLIDHRVGNASICWNKKSIHKANEWIDTKRENAT